MVGMMKLMKRMRMRMMAGFLWVGMKVGWW